MLISRRWGTWRAKPTCGGSIGAETLYDTGAGPLQSLVRLLCDRHSDYL